MKRPPSPQQLEANRRNSRKSTGPTSSRGRAISSQNCRKYQLLPFENPALPAQLTAKYYGYFIPSNIDERRLVNRLICSDRIRRYLQSLKTRVRAGGAPASASRRLMMVPYQLDVADCAYRNVQRQLEAIRAKAA
jgi:hypothetical protein